MVKKKLPAFYYSTRQFDSATIHNRNVYQSRAANSFIINLASPNPLSRTHTHPSIHIRTKLQLVLRRLSHCKKKREIQRDNFLSLARTHAGNANSAFQRFIYKSPKAILYNDSLSLSARAHAFIGGCIASPPCYGAADKGFLSRARRHFVIAAEVRDRSQECPTRAYRRSGGDYKNTVTDARERGRKRERERERVEVESD